MMRKHGVLLPLRAAPQAMQRHEDYSTHLGIAQPTRWARTRWVDGLELVCHARVLRGRCGEKRCDAFATTPPNLKVSMITQTSYSRIICTDAGMWAKMQHDELHVASEQENVGPHPHTVEGRPKLHRSWHHRLFGRGLLVLLDAVG